MKGEQSNKAIKNEQFVIVFVIVYGFFQGSRGDLLVSLCYNPTANTITVSIIKARNLKAMDIGGTSGIDAPSSSFLQYIFTFQQQKMRK